MKLLYFKTLLFPVKHSVFLITTFFLLFTNTDKNTHFDNFNFPVLVLQGKTIIDFLPNGWSIRDSIMGDLNKDKVEDVAVILEYNDSVKEMNRKSFYINSEHKTHPRILFVIFKVGDHYELKLQQNSFILRDGEMGDNDPYEGMDIKNGVLHINFNSTASGGANELNYLFRYQQNDFYLIGATETSDSNGGGYWRADFNFSTRKYIFQSGNTDGTIDHIEKKDLPLNVLKKISELKMPLSWEVLPRHTI